MGRWGDGKRDILLRWPYGETHKVIIIINIVIIIIFLGELAHEAASEVL